MTAREKNHLIGRRMNARGISISFYDVNTLRRCEITLHSWAEAECGNDSYCIERDETTGKPYRIYSNYPGKRYAVPDREKGALKRIESTCKRLGLHYFHQTDPRGCALYVAKEPMTDSNYSSIGVAVCE